MNKKTLMIAAAVLAAWWFLKPKQQAVPGTGQERLIQQQNLYVDP